VERVNGGCAGGVVVGDFAGHGRETHELVAAHGGTEVHTFADTGCAAAAA
jgi:hypothetical protein